MKYKEREIIYSYKIGIMELIPDSIWCETAEQKTKSILSWKEITAELVRRGALTKLTNV